MYKKPGCVKSLWGLLIFTLILKEATEEFGFFEISCLIPLVQYLQQTLYFPLPKHSISKLALLCMGEWIQVWFNNSSRRTYCIYSKIYN